jgi:hypothetical protein
LAPAAARRCVQGSTQHNVQQYPGQAIAPAAWVRAYTRHKGHSAKPTSVQYLVRNGSNHTAFIGVRQGHIRPGDGMESDFPQPQPWLLLKVNTNNHP